MSRPNGLPGYDYEAETRWKTAFFKCEYLRSSASYENIMY